MEKHSRKTDAVSRTALHMSIAAAKHLSRGGFCATASRPPYELQGHKSVTTS